MKQILWSVLAILAAIFVGCVVVGLVELLGLLVYPLPPDLNFNDEAAQKEHMAGAPPLAMAIVALAWGAGPFAGTLAACAIARRKYVLHGLIVGVIFAVFDALNYFSFPHPIWMMVAGIVFPLLTSSAAARLAQILFPQKACSSKPYDMREKNMAC